MKKWLPVIVMLFSLHSFSQTCEQKEAKLAEAVSGFSAATLYNTYGLIGAVADAYEKGSYDAKTVEELMTAQQTMLTGLGNLLDSMVAQNIFTGATARDLASGAIAIFNGLKDQAKLLIEYARSNSSRKQEAYGEKRKQNWTAISKLMGIKE